jgi:hypothetical protein
MQTTHILSIKDVHRGVSRIDLTAEGCLICDIDGTIADISHRLHYITNKPKNFAAFESVLHLDQPIQTVIAAVRSIYDYGWDVVMCTGRNARTRGGTLEWLERVGIRHHGLYMRQDGDHRVDTVVKYELLAQIIADGFDPTMVFDDRERVVAAWRRAGLHCVQVAEGSY